MAPGEFIQGLASEPNSDRGSVEPIALERLDVIEVERISWTDNKWYRFALGQTGMYKTKRVFEEPGMDAQREANVTRPNLH